MPKSLEQELHALRDAADRRLAESRRPSIADVLPKARRARLIGISGSLVAVFLAGIATVVLSASPSSNPVANTEASPASSPPDVQTRPPFANYKPPATGRDGKTFVEGQFPDGTDVVLRYADGLALHETGFRPTGALELTVDNKGCGTIFLSSYGMDGAFHPPGSPLMSFVTPKGSQVELWESYPDDPAIHYLMFRFGDWYIAVADSTSRCVTRDGWAEVWARSLEGSVDENGFLQLIVGPSLRLRDSRLTLSNDELYLDIKKLKDNCAMVKGYVETADGVRLNRSNNFAGWCTIGTTVEFHADSTDEDHLDRLAESLRVGITD